MMAQCVNCEGAAVYCSACYEEVLRLIEQANLAVESLRQSLIMIMRLDCERIKDELERLGGHDIMRP